MLKYHIIKSITNNINNNNTNNIINIKK